MRQSVRQEKPTAIQFKHNPSHRRSSRFDLHPRLSEEETGSDLERSNSLASVQDILASPGQPLDPVTRSWMESRFGHDFSKVRIHHDDQAAESAESLGALAYTAGRDVAFARDRYRPGQIGGAALLAHELSHVVQQSSSTPASLDLSAPESALEQEADLMAQQVVSNERGFESLPSKGTAPFSIQCQTVTCTRSSIPLFELGGTFAAPRQTLTGSSSAGNAVLQLSYDPATSVFSVTFPLVWIFPHAFTDTQRFTYVDEFVDAVERVWNDRFQLNETVAPRRTARVHIFFSSNVIRQLASQAHENAQLMGATTGRWLMDVRNLLVRENVNRFTSVVELGATSNQSISRSAAALRRLASFSISGTGGNRNFSQSTSAHEFGHMIGLGDEYLEDAGTPVTTALRGQITDRIMNVGENVTADAYAPFVEWLSGLTSTRWSVGRRIR